MRNYELAFEVAWVTDELAADVADAMDAVVATHGDVTRVLVEVSGSNGVEAAALGVARLRGLGVRVRRVAEDLVTRKDIADRLEVSPQAVGSWIRGERLADFPSAWNPVSGGVWLWSEVAEWARAHGQKLDDGDHLTRDEYNVANGMLSSGLVTAAPGWTGVAFMQGQLHLGARFDQTTSISVTRDSFTIAA